MKSAKPDNSAPPKKAPAKYEGSRLSSLILLFLTVLASLAFYTLGQP